MPEPTKAQLKLLQWLVRKEKLREGMVRASFLNSAKDAPEYQRQKMLQQAREFRGGDLVEYYAERRAEEWDENINDEKIKDASYRGGGGYANHGWRRAGGTVLKRLAKAEFMVCTGYSIGVPQYELTTKGRVAGEHQTALEESIMEDTR